jgi:hypothetical protein
MIKTTNVNSIPEPAKRKINSRIKLKLLKLNALNYLAPSLPG